MIKTQMFVNDVEVGYINSAKEIKGSILNDFGIREAVFFKSQLPTLKKIYDSPIKVAGSLRLQRVWNFQEFADKDENLTLGRIVFRPDGMCVACAGSGKYRATTHKSTAKCPSCKGSGYVKDTWNEQEIKKDANSSNVVDGSKDNPGTDRTAERADGQGSGQKEPIPGRS